MKTNKMILFLLLITCFSCSKETFVENEELQEAISQVWLDADSAQELLNHIDVHTLSHYDKQRYRLTEAHLMLKRKLCIPQHTDLDALALFFEDCGDAPSLGEVYYIQGAYLNWQGKNTESMRMLKNAESQPTTSIIKGMTYYKMGRISESEQLYEIALDNYEKALPHLQSAKIPLYLASVYRELGRMNDNESKNWYFDSALVYAEEYGDTILYLDIRYAQLTTSQIQSPEVARICQYLCHQAGLKRYAYDLVKYYIRVEEADSARIYLDILAADSTAQTWSEQQYILWHSQYLRLKGRNNEAYQELYRLYNENYSILEEKGRSSTFVIAQHYDNEVEHAKNLQLQLEKQRLYIVLVLVLAAILGTMILLILLGAKRKTERLVEQARTQQKFKDLHKELQLRRDSLKQVLNQRLELNKNLQEALLTKKKEEKIPDWAQQFIDSNIFSTDEQWEHFFNEFNGCYGTLMERLKTEHPRLTSTDTQVLALYILGLDNSDICLLMGLTQRTIWSRRMRIKSRIGLGEKESLDKWLEEELKKE